MKSHDLFKPPRARRGKTVKKRKWTAESIAKMRATRAANKAAKLADVPEGLSPDARIKDAVAYLTTAKSAVSPTYKGLLIELALCTLKGVK